MDMFDLPEPIIQVVQSFLTSKQAAQTPLLSMSWRSAWLTCPNLDFDHADFCRSNSIGNSILNRKFFEFAEKTLERYENSNLSIHSFRLSMQSMRYCDNARATKLVRRAMKLGPTRLTLEFGNSVFRYESFLSLTAKGCRIDLNRDEVCCSSLRFLSFNNIRIKHPGTIFHIISRCPLIEKLSLRYVYVRGKSVNVGDGMLMTITTPLHSLKSLVLKHGDFDTTLFLADFSSKLPSLKDLALRISRNREEILISSPTLERMDFNIEDYYVYGYTVKVVKLDVPSIRKLTFACSEIPDEVSIISNSRGWESCVSVTHVKCLNASWFYRMSNFIDKFKFSRMSMLSLHVYFTEFLHHEVGDIRGLSTPEIENMTTQKYCCALFDGLFQMCHPKVVNIQCVSTYGTHIINFLVKRLLDTRDANVPTPNQYYLMYGMNECIKVARASAGFR